MSLILLQLEIDLLKNLDVRFTDIQDPKKSGSGPLTQRITASKHCQVPWVRQVGGNAEHYS